MADYVVNPGFEVVEGASVASALSPLANPYAQFVEIDDGKWDGKRIIFPPLPSAGTTRIQSLLLSMTTCIITPKRTPTKGMLCGVVY
ncbi:MAG: hypothetical protein CM1200mP34_4570 [Verrucomicrobiales bacterium]|nr:MAG: hypothetical protein CM1200mP34_4570 [Verrucomicrobiales bacterium]